jgi:hypothetical protein
MRPLRLFFMPEKCAERAECFTLRARDHIGALDLSPSF